MIRLAGGVAFAILVGAAAACFSLLRWQSTEEARATCQSNERRLSNALLLYAQDNDGCLPLSESQLPNGGWTSWIAATDAYGPGGDVAQCPANRAEGSRSASTGAPYPYSYALNDRFYGVFGHGPFAVENLEIAAQTALIVEAGRERSAGPFGPPALQIAGSSYSDTGARPNAYPSPHNRRMCVTAADGHAVSLTIAHYSASGHDALYGRLGGSIYNWNGGHPNGRTADPPLE